MPNVVTKQRLLSKQFQKNAKLQRCLVAPLEHVVPNSGGEHVGLIQEALVKLGAGVISASEISRQFYGPSTRQAVLKYKGPPRNIINKTYQSAPDNIVGQMTIDRLDDEMLALENKPDPNPPLTSRLVSLTMAGAPHDHTKCPSSGFDGPDGRVHHLATPINPLGFGRKINIGGEHETDYLGFQDFTTEPISAGPKNRPLTSILGNDSVSDICLRSSPITPHGETELLRIAKPLCRLTVATNSIFAASMEEIVARLGVVIERDILVDFTPPDGLGFHIMVAVMKSKR
jgi:hypothetical protein